jgi:AcrR family transcriptional regulator
VGVPRVSDAHKEQVRQRLIDAARRVVFRDGHEGATTRAILAEAGMSAGALYTYFASKEELFEALAEQVIDGNIALFGATAAPGADAATVLRSFATDVLTQPDTSPALTHFRGRMASDPDVRAAIARFNRYLVTTFAGVIAVAQSDGTFPADVDAEAFVELFDIIVEGLNRRDVLGTFATSFERVGAVAVDRLLDAVSDPEGSTNA